ncbi:MAG: hypothetical protein IJ685_04785 [Selenomonadaceae bacterium]|nr:hypothetical protein [Selenomonadaceae bacterium]
MKLKIFAPLILSVIILLTGCGRHDSPEAALNEIKIALAERDEKKISARVDMDKFFSQTYDAATVELAKNYDAYKEKYPDDPYFQHSAEFLTEYNAEHKARHLKFLDGVKDSFFDKIPAPEVPEDNPTAYVADEFQKICDATTATVKETIFEGDKATVVLDVHGDNSLRGMFVGQWTFKLAFHRDEKNLWHFDGIANLDELTPALVDKAEIVWITFF